MTGTSKAREFYITWSVEPEYIEEPIREAREELFNEVVEQVEDVDGIDTEHPKQRLLSGDLDGAVLVGTIVANNLLLFRQIFKIIVNDPKAVLESVGSSGDIVVFKTPLNTNFEFSPDEVNVDIGPLVENNEYTVWQASERPEQLEENDYYRLVENVNDMMDEDYTVEEFREEFGSEGKD